MQSPEPKKLYISSTISNLYLKLSLTNLPDCCALCKN